MTAKKDQGFTVGELLIVVAILSVNATIAVPRLVQTQMTSNEASAIAALKVTTSAQVAYSAVCGNGGYAMSFVVLGTPPRPGGQGFVSADLGSALAPQRSGYNFTLGAGAGAFNGPNDCNGSATVTVYLATGTPMILDTTGTRSFAVNQRNTLWQLTGAVAPSEPFGAPATKIQ